MPSQVQEINLSWYEIAKCQEQVGSKVTIKGWGGGPLATYSREGAWLRQSTRRPLPDRPAWQCQSRLSRRSPRTIGCMATPKHRESALRHACMGRQSRRAPIYRSSTVCMAEPKHQGSRTRPACMGRLSRQTPSITVNRVHGCAKAPGVTHTNPPAWHRQSRLDRQTPSITVSVHSLLPRGDYPFAVGEGSRIRYPIRC